MYCTAIILNSDVQYCQKEVPFTDVALYPLYTCLTLVYNNVILLIVWLFVVVLRSGNITSLPFPSLPSHLDWFYWIFTQSSWCKKCNPWLQGGKIPFRKKKRTAIINNTLNSKRKQYNSVMVQKYLEKATSPKEKINSVWIWKKQKQKRTQTEQYIYNTWYW